MNDYDSNGYWNNSPGDDPDHGRDYMKAGSRANMSTAAMILSLIAVMTFQVFFISLPCAAVAIVLSLLSKGSGRLRGRAQIALVTAIVAAVLSASITGYAFYTIMHNPDMKAQIESMYDYYLNPDSSSESDGSDVQDPEDLIREIISGDYRRSGESGSSQDSASPDAPSSGEGSQLSAAPQNGGSYI